MEVENTPDLSQIKNKTSVDLSDDKKNSASKSYRAHSINVENGADTVENGDNNVDESLETVDLKDLKDTKEIPVTTDQPF